MIKQSDSSLRDSRQQRWQPVAALAPGLALCLAGAALALGINQALPTVSPLLIAIVLGAVLANVVHLPQRLHPGTTFSSTKLLRTGIALLGLQLLVGDIIGLGAEVIILVVVIVLLGMLGTVYLGKLLGLSWTQRVLIACGFSICGAAAVAAVDGVTEAEEDEVITAVALVVIFGTAMIPIIPLLGHLFGLSDTEAGMWAGGSVHEVAQVIAASSALGGSALGVALVVKLARVLMLAPVIAALSVRQRSIAGKAGTTKRPPLIPLFVLGFLACAGLRSAGVIPSGLIDGATQLQTALLTTAMFALGTGVRIATIARVGARPFVLAAAATMWVASIALVGVLLADTAVTA